VEPKAHAQSCRLPRWDVCQAVLIAMTPRVYAGGFRMMEGGRSVLVVRDDKKQFVEELAEKMERARCMVLTDYRGLNVENMNALRKSLREAGVEYRVVKNTMTYLAAEKLGLAADLEEYLAGPTAIAFGYEDAVAPAKSIAEFARKSDSLEIKVGVLNGRVIGIDEVKALADLPSRPELLAHVARAFASPMQAMANVLSAPLRGFATVLDARREQLEEEAA